MTLEMCYIIGGVILLVGGFLTYIYQHKFIVDWKSKLPLIAQILKSEVKEKSKEDFVYKDLVIKNNCKEGFVIEGDYLGRKITVTYCEYWETSVGSGGRGRFVKAINFTTDSQKKYERPKKFARYYPTPTKYTYINDGSVVHFNFPAFWDKKFKPEWSEIQICKAFEEIIQGAQVVELGKSFYVSKAKFRIS